MRYNDKCVIFVAEKSERIMPYTQLKLDNQLCFRIYTASRLITSTYTPFFKKLGITYPQYLVLLLLWEKDKRMVGEITEKLHLETNTVTPLLQRMEKQGLVLRQKSESDSRCCMVSLTQAGREMEEQAKEIPNCVARSIVENGMSVEDLKLLIPLLDKLTCTLL